MKFPHRFICFLKKQKMRTPEVVLALETLDLLTVLASHQKFIVELYDGSSAEVPVNPNFQTSWTKGNKPRVL